ncbi:hypothetical protein HOI83_01655 [Candidatus Uhrbacteria bacterium]|nr:hypothetical protein [Candidatus Uhrbacteria bacterium]
MKFIKEFITELALGLLIALVVIPGCAWIDQERSFPDELMEDERADEVIVLKVTICELEHKIDYGVEVLKSVHTQELAEVRVEHDQLVTDLMTEYDVSFEKTPWFRVKARSVLAIEQGLRELYQKGDQWHCPKPIM